MRLRTLTLLALAATAAPAQAVVGGTPVPQGQLRFVADVYIGGAFGCTGALLAPRWGMTAGHCGPLTRAPSEGVVPSQLPGPARADKGPPRRAHPHRPG